MPRGMVVPSENVKSSTATRVNITKRNLIVRLTKEEREGFTYDSQEDSIAGALCDETIKPMPVHLVKPGFGPAFRLDYLLHFLPKRLHILRKGSQVVERAHKRLRSFVIAESDLIIHR